VIPIDKIIFTGLLVRLLLLTVPGQSCYLATDGGPLVHASDVGPGNSHCSQMYMPTTNIYTPAPENQPSNAAADANIIICRRMYVGDAPSRGPKMPQQNNDERVMCSSHR